MTHGKGKAANGRQYMFRGSRFWIPTEELITAIRESRQLHQKLMADLLQEVERQKGLLARRSRAET